MSTWHQQKAMKRDGVRLFHPTDWTVVMDPPNQMMALYRASTKELAEVYMRGLKAHNPAIAAHSYILKPAKVKA